MENVRTTRNKFYIWVEINIWNIFDIRTRFQHNNNCHRYISHSERHEPLASFKLSLSICSDLFSYHTKMYIFDSKCTSFIFYQMFWFNIWLVLDLLFPTNVIIYKLLFSLECVSLLSLHTLSYGFTSLEDWKFIRSVPKQVSQKNQSKVFHPFFYSFFLHSYSDRIDFLFKIVSLYDCFMANGNI